MRILFAHNRYQYRGGEDSVVDAELALLRDAGHEVEALFWDNEAITQIGKLGAAARTVWSREAAGRVAQAVARFKPEVLHAHNTFPLASPAIYWAARERGVPVVQTLHNFRLLCVQALLLRDAAVCEDCLGRLPWRGVVHRCYRGSASASAAVATMITTHRLLGSYRDKVTRYIALNDFCRRKFIEGGLPAARIVIKPNFVAAAAAPDEAPRHGLLFVGRLSQEKGVATLAAAARLMPEQRITVIGTGPDEALLDGIANLERLGARPVEEVMQKMTQASALLLPSIWYENFPRTLVEAFAQALPVIASRIGALAELIDDERTGLLFAPGDAADLARQARRLVSQPERARQMARHARAVYEAEFTPTANLRRLLAIYAEAKAAAA